MKRIILTDEEWMSIINKERDGLPCCCANVSDLRDMLITIARNDGDVWFPEKLKESIKFVLDGHDNLPLIEKIRDVLYDKKIANKIYDVLVNVGGATEHMRDSFVYAYELDEITEWRFSGNLGFGGKYWSQNNSVNYYSEDETKERDILVDKINKLLSDIVNGDKNVSTS